MIAIIDYGVGNLRNVYMAFKRMNKEAVITSREEDITASSGIVLPGVGAYRDAMKSLRDTGLIPCIKACADANKPLLGICLGMQLLYEKSYEDGEYKGLGLLKGEIVKLQVPYKVPHMGWNRLDKRREDSMLEGFESGEYAYFVHSYYLETAEKDQIILTADYGVQVPALVRKNNLVGMQFHPEKSSTTGEKLLRNFIKLTEMEDKI